MVQSHMKTVAASPPNFGTHQDGQMENKVCTKCGKRKKFKTVAAEMITELDVIPRLKAGNPRGNQVLYQDRDEILSRAIRRRNQTRQRTTSSPLLSGKVGFGGSTEMIPCRQREQKYRPTQDVMQPTLMTFEPSGVKARPNQDRIANSRNPMISGRTRISRENEEDLLDLRQHLQPPHLQLQVQTPVYLVLQTADYNEVDLQVDLLIYRLQVDLLIYNEAGRRSMASSSLYSASSTDFLTRTTDYSASSSSSEELDSPPRRAMQLDRHRIDRSISRSRSSQTHWSSTSYDSSSEEEYPVSRRSRFSKADPPQEKMGHVRRLTTKLAGMFYRDHHEDADASSSSRRI